MASRAEVERLSVSELKAFLTTRLANDVSEESLANLEMNRVSGRTFLELDDNDLAQLFPLIGERKAVKLFIGECTQRQVSLQVVPWATPQSMSLVPVSQAPALNQLPDLKDQVCEWLSKRKESLRLLEKFANDFESFASRQETIGKTFVGSWFVAAGSMVLGVVAAPLTGGASLAAAVPVFTGAWATGMGAGVTGIVNQTFGPSIAAVQQALDEDLEKSKHLNRLFAISGRNEKVNESDISLNLQGHRPLVDEIRALISKLRTDYQKMKGILG